MALSAQINASSRFDFVVRAKLCGYLPILVLEPRPALKFLPHLRRVELIHVGNIDFESDSLVFPLQKRHRRIRAALVKSIGQEFCVGSCLGIYWNSQSIILWVVLKTAPASRVVGKNPHPRSGFLQLQEQPVGARLEFSTFNFHIVREADGGGFIGARSPWRRPRRAQVSSKKPYFTSSPHI